MLDQPRFHNDGRTGAASGPTWEIRVDMFSVGYKHFIPPRGIIFQQQLGL
jgi:hypothetical protein